MSTLDTLAPADGAPTAGAMVSRVLMDSSGVQGNGDDPLVCRSSPSSSFNRA